MSINEVRAAWLASVRRRISSLKLRMAELRAVIHIRGMSREEAARRAASL